MSPRDRKIALLRAGVTHAQIAADLHVSRSHVTHVLAGRRLTGPDARRVMEHIARLIGRPLDEVFPVTTPELASA